MGADAANIKWQVAGSKPTFVRASTAPATHKADHGARQANPQQEGEPCLPRSLPACPRSLPAACPAPLLPAAGLCACRGPVCLLRGCEALPRACCSSAMAAAGHRLRRFAHICCFRARAGSCRGARGEGSAPRSAAGECCIGRNFASFRCHVGRGTDGSFRLRPSSFRRHRPPPPPPPSRCLSLPACLFGFCSGRRTMSPCPR